MEVDLRDAPAAFFSDLAPHELKYSTYVRRQVCNVLAGAQGTSAGTLRSLTPDEAARLLKMISFTPPTNVTLSSDQARWSAQMFKSEVQLAFRARWSSNNPMSELLISARERAKRYADRPSGWTEPHISEALDAATASVSSAIASRLSKALTDGKLVATYEPSRGKREPIPPNDFRRCSLNFASNKIVIAQPFEQLFKVKVSLGDQRPHGNAFETDEVWVEKMHRLVTQEGMTPPAAAEACAPQAKKEKSDGKIGSVEARLLGKFYKAYPDLKQRPGRPSDS